MADQAEFCPPSVAGNFTVTTGTYYGTTIGQYVYLDEQNQFQTLQTIDPAFRDDIKALQATPIAHAKWEGEGGQPHDAGLVSTVNLADAIKAVERNVHRELQGLSATHAISALHDQRRADGRPFVFLPEGL